MAVTSGSGSVVRQWGSSGSPPTTRLPLAGLQLHLGTGAMEMEDINMELFMCTNYRVKLTMIFTCYKQRPRIFQILDSGQNEEVLAIPGIGRCCHVSCCFNSTAGDQFGVGGGVPQL